MYNETDLAAAIRRLAIGAVECGKPSALCYGTVLSAAPLRVQVDEKLVLGSAQLALSSLVSNFSVEMQVRTRRMKRRDTDTRMRAKKSLLC